MLSVEERISIEEKVKKDVREEIETLFKDILSFEKKCSIKKVAKLNEK